MSERGLPARSLFRIFLTKFDYEQVIGTYNNGNILLDERIDIDKPVKVIVTFIDENTAENKRLTLDDFSFAKSRELLKHLTGTISDAVIEGRRSGHLL